MYVRQRSPRRLFIVGLALLFVGAYYLLQTTFGVALPEIAWDRIWPVLLVVLGALMLWGAYPLARTEAKV